MKKTGILNRDLSEVIASLGHTDRLVIADAGLPIPPETRRVDLALTAGIPAFLDTVRAVLGEMQVERAIVASEMADRSPAMRDALLSLVGDTPLEAVPHETFKTFTRAARAVVRTGEFTPYANVILVAGTVF